MRGRFIPARAGNTTYATRLAALRPVHPRAGGEHHPYPRRRRARTGSSPRGRGTRVRASLRLRGPRFIPARAGNTALALAGAGSGPVHPRAGGEHRFGSVAGTCYGGSSPRGRGTRRRHAPAGGEDRFIPARAGNTDSWRILQRARSVHPRAGGEHGESAEAVLAEYGSSPRGRGTPRSASASNPLSRFIPARAGNTTPTCSGRRRRPVHPRAGGEHGL